MGRPVRRQWTIDTLQYTALSTTARAFTRTVCPVRSRRREAKTLTPSPGRTRKNTTLAYTFWSSLQSAFLSNVKRVVKTHLFGSLHSHPPSSRVLHHLLLLPPPWTRTHTRSVSHPRGSFHDVSPRKTPLRTFKVFSGWFSNPQLSAGVVRSRHHNSSGLSRGSRRRLRGRPF